MIVDPIIRIISTIFSVVVLANNLKWINAGIVIASGAQSSAPMSPRNLSILLATVRAITTETTTTTVLYKFLSQYRQLPFAAQLHSQLPKI